MATKNQTLAVAAACIALLLLASLLLYLYEPTRTYLMSDTLLRESVERFGVLAPLAVILYHLIQVIIAPIPGQPIDIATGYIFGPYLGIAIGLIGIYLGSLFAIILARRFGRPLVEHLVPKQQFQTIDRFLHERSTWFYVILFLIPISPGDLICLALGLTRIPIWRTLLIVLLGRTPVVITAVLVGASGRHLKPLEFMGVAAVVIVVVLLVLRFLPLERIKQFHFWTR